MASRKPLVLLDNGRVGKLPAGDTLDVPSPVFLPAGTIPLFLGPATAATGEAKWLHVHRFNAAVFKKILIKRLHVQSSPEANDDGLTKGTTIVQIGRNPEFSGGVLSVQLVADAFENEATGSYLITPNTSNQAMYVRFFQAGFHANVVLTFDYQVTELMP